MSAPSPALIPSIQIVTELSWDTSSPLIIWDRFSARNSVNRLLLLPGDRVIPMRPASSARPRDQPPHDWPDSAGPTGLVENSGGSREVFCRRPSGTWGEETRDF